MLVVLTLNFFLFEPKFVLVFRLTRLSSSRRLAGMTADLACQMSSCLCQDHNILMLFNYTNETFYTLETWSTFYFVFVSSKKIIKIKQAFKNIQQPRTFRYFFGEMFKFQWKSGACATNFPAVLVMGDTSFFGFDTIPVRYHEFWSIPISKSIPMLNFFHLLK